MYFKTMAAAKQKNRYIPGYTGGEEDFRGYSKPTWLWTKANYPSVFWEFVILELQKLNQ